VTLAFLFAEQNIAFLELADGVSFVEGGRMRYSGTTEGLNDDEKLRAAFFGAANNEEAR
jgi:ABC-type branched-subunit amino acid transport system ATPase component